MTAQPGTTTTSIGWWKRPQTILAQTLLFTQLTNAFSFTITNKPTQCGEVNVRVEDGGEPPFSLVLIPAGALPDGQTEIRTIVDVEFSEREFTLPALAFPGESNFLAMMGDSTGVGTGGTSVITDVAPSSDTSCLATEPTTPLFFIFIDPAGAPRQCSTMNIGWDNPQGPVTLWGLIPGGESFGITVPDGASSVDWTPRVPEGVQMLLLAGDSRGRGTGGSTPVQAVLGGSGDCLNGDEVYSSTEAPFAGGQYLTGSGGGTVTGGGNIPTGSNAPPSQGNSGGSSSDNIPLIVGLAVGLTGGLAVIGLLLFLLWRRRDKKKRRQFGGTKPIDLLKSEQEPKPTMAGRNDPNLEPTPLVLPPAPTSDGRSSSEGRPSTGMANNRRGSASTWGTHAPLVNGTNRAFSPTTEATSDWTGSETGTNDRSSILTSTMNHQAGGLFGMRGGERPKTPQGPSSWRPVSYVQHRDAGAVATEPSPPISEVVELPPSYADVNRGQGGSHVSPK